jgi:hypothetical protein
MSSRDKLTVRRGNNSQMDQLIQVIATLEATMNRSRAPACVCPPCQALSPLTGPAAAHCRGRRRRDF